MSETGQGKKTFETSASLLSSSPTLAISSSPSLSTQTGPRVPQTHQNHQPPEPRKETLSLPLCDCCALSHTFFVHWAHPLCIVTFCPDPTCLSESRIDLILPYSLPSSLPSPASASLPRLCLFLGRTSLVRAVLLFVSLLLRVWVISGRVSVSLIFFFFYLHRSFVHISSLERAS